MRVIILFLLLALATCSLRNDAFKYKRKKMVEEQIEARGISNKATLDALKKVGRHLFVPKNYIDQAYDDNPLPIGYGQTISQPFIVAYMTEVVDPRKHFKVLEIGTGSGYQAAILAEIVDNVYTVEIIPELGIKAKEKLKELGYKNVEVKIADGFYGWKEHSPYDAIIVTAAPEYIPPPLVDQLADGGKMVIPVGTPFYVQTLMLVEKRGNDIITRNLLPVSFVPFTRKD